jgi:hypothetical protein
MDGLLKDILLEKTKMEDKSMKKLVAIITLLLSVLSFGSLVFADQYQGGSGSGGAMAECEFRLDGGKVSKGEIASSEGVKSHIPRNDGGRTHNGGDGAQYRGGQGAGGAMGEGEARLESINKQKK